MFGLKSILGEQKTSYIKKLRPIVAGINDLEQTFEKLSPADLKGKTADFKKRLKTGEAPDALLPDAFALVREAAKRTLSQRHFDVQLMGGVILHRGNIAEMRTGEGKTLVATLPAYLNALSEKGVHVITVNDYLARRDAVWMGQIYFALGLSIGVINHDASYLYDPSHTTEQTDEARDDLGSFKVQHDFLRPCSRKEAYAADITYGTNNEFGFDYLRDNIEYDTGNIRQRGYHYAIVDEIDSILIDEARTPLIISAPAADSENLYAVFSRIARPLERDADFTLDEKRRAVQLTDQGIEKAEKALGVDNIYTEKGIKYVHHLETAVRAKALFERDKQYVVRDSEVVIVDEFTGRLQPGRRWSEGLHQAVEAKEGVPVQKESRTFASITFQNYFRMYEKLSGMTGTALTSAEEFYTVYGLETIPVPTNVSPQRIDREDLIFQTEKGKTTAIVRKVKELHEKGQPVLIGTVSIEKNEELSKELARADVPHEVLNAKNHEREGEIIAGAGERGKVTLATNMAGRGVDIKLGGIEADEAARGAVLGCGGLFVLGTERHEARRIDNQLRGRSGRQGDPGETQFFVSLEDSLMRVFASDMVKRMMGRFGIPEDEPIYNRLISRSLESAQTKIEGFNFDARKHVLSYDDVLNHQRHIIYGRRRRVLEGDEAELEAVLAELVAADAEVIRAVEEKKKTLGADEFHTVFRRLYLQTVDMFWVEHLEVMEYMRGSVNLRAYGQRDPLIEYKKEGLRLFQEMEGAVEEQILKMLPNIGVGAFAREQNQLRAAHKSAQLIGGSKDAGVSASVRASSAPRNTDGTKIGRNQIVTITDGTETKALKYKKAEPLIASGKWRFSA